MNVRCPVCGAAVALAVGDTRLACAACGLLTPVSRVGTAPGAALVALEAELTGTALASYTVVERIGAGGMGTVYRARGRDGDVAIKVLRPGLGTDRSAVLARFAREALALRRLDHPHVVRFLEHGQEGDVAYIVTELVPGRDLAATLAAGRLALPAIVELFGQVCDGVAAAHAAGIVHRDLKPANILVGDRGVKVADFGLAQLGPDTAITTLTRTDVAMGTFHYLAPEQRKDSRSVDHRADIWALGVILYEMLTGELPLGSFAPAGDRRADAIVRRALAPDPAARFDSVDEMGRAVRALVAPPRRRRRLVAAAAAVLLATGAAGAVVMTVGRDSATETAAGTEPAAVTDAATGTATVADAATETATVADAAAETVAAAASIDAGIDAPRGDSRVDPIGKRSRLDSKPAATKRITRPTVAKPAATKRVPAKGKIGKRSKPDI